MPLSAVAQRLKPLKGCPARLQQGHECIRAGSGDTTRLDDAGGRRSRCPRLRDSLYGCCCIFEGSRWSGRRAG
jgi:hypothetical protein